MLAVVFPRLHGLQDRYLDSDSERLALFLSYAGEKAASSRTYYRVGFDLQGARINVESSPDGKEFAPAADPALRGFKLKNGVDIGEVSAPGLGKVVRGEAKLLMPPAGAPPFEVALISGNRRSLITYNPYTGRATISEKNEKPGKR
ncbi:MAG: hypothetical protein A2054_05370 [Deltaproteobacteria bacterium GWA2_55_10]|nr:MAG: hypothetical protein A2054_05370 [Deltaproteobacteria bacterium GWA2_55_10]